MPIAIALTQVPGLTTKVVQPGDQQIQNGDAIPFKRNYGQEIISLQAAKRQMTYGVEGLNGTEVFNLDALAQQNLTNQVQASDPTYITINFSGLIYPDCFLKTVVPSGSLGVGTELVVEKTTLTFETKARYPA